MVHEESLHGTVWVQEEGGGLLASSIQDLTSKFWALWGILRARGCARTGLGCRVWGTSGLGFKAFGFRIETIFTEHKKGEHVTT